jgi:hypothetical protein
MKHRTVIVTLELETELTLRDLRSKSVWQEILQVAVVQKVSAQVATAPKSVKP